MNYMSVYEDIRNNSDVLDCSLSYNKDSYLYEILKDIEADEVIEYLSEYPRNNYAELKELLCTCYSHKTYVIGSGSEDLIWRLNTFILANKKVGVVLPNFYRIFQTLKEVYTIDIPFEKDKLNMDIHLLTDALKKGNYDAVWISNPNPITGKGFYAKELLTLIANMPDVLFIIDEASMDSVLSIDSYSLMTIKENIHNLIVLRTFSKFYGLPGMRLGYASLSEKNADILETTGQVFPVSNLSLLIAKKILLKKQQYDKMRIKIDKNKQMLYAIFHENNEFFIYSSLSNTVIVKCIAPNSNIWQMLKDSGILSFSFDEDEFISLENSVRVTIHSDETYFKKLLYAMQSLIGRSNLQVNS